MRRATHAATRAATHAGLLAACALALAGCGWHAGLLVPEGARTLGVRFLDNTTRLPGVEVELTQAIGRAARDRVDLRSASPTTADLRLEGELIELRRWAGVRSRLNEQLEASVQLAVVLRLVDVHTGEPLATTQRELRAGYVVDPGFGVANTPAESAARSRVIANLAEGLVLDLFRPLN